MRFGSWMDYKAPNLNSCLRLFILVHSLHCIVTVCDLSMVMLRKFLSTGI